MTAVQVISCILSLSFLGAFMGGNLSYNTFLQEKEAKKEAKISVYREASDREASWIISLQQDDGALFLYEPDDGGQGHVNPYFACQAMLGLISDNEPEHIERAGRYLNWHTNALLNEDGYITNYSMKNGALVSDEKADSFDSYAAEYILLLSEYLGRGGDPEVIGDWKEAVQLLADRFDEVTRFDVTYVNRKFRVAYLMDNTEVWEAADSLGRLLTTKKEYRSDPEFNALGRRYLSISYALKHSIPEKFYLKEENYYTVGIDGEGNNTGSPDLDDFYPDAVAQLYPAVTGFLAVKSKERELYEKVCDYHDWEKDRIEDTTFEWSVMAYAAAVHKDEERLMAYIETYRSFTEKKRSYPMHTANAGWIMRACNRAIDDLRNEKDTGFMNYIKWIFEEDR